MNDEFMAECPHCERLGFADEDAWFEHVSTCEQEQQQDSLRDEEE